MIGFLSRVSRALPPKPGGLFSAVPSTKTCASFSRGSRTGASPGLRVQSRKFGPDEPKMLQTEDLIKTYKGRKVVDNVCLEVDRGEVVGLLGPNGAGKTTTFYIMVGLTHPDAGRVLLDGKDLTAMPMYQRARQ